MDTTEISLLDKLLNVSKMNYYVIIKIKEAAVYELIWQDI